MYTGLYLSNFVRGGAGVDVLGFDTRTGTVPQVSGPTNCRRAPTKSPCLRSSCSRCLRAKAVSLAEYLATVYMLCMIFCRHHQLPRSIIAFVNDHIIFHYLTAPLTLPIPTSSPDNWLMINNNYHNYLTYFLVFSYKTLQIDILHILSPSVFFIVSCV